MNHPVRTNRSIDPDDYQELTQPIAVMAKSFISGFNTLKHSHARDQLIYAHRGVMRVRTQAETWIIPPNRAVYILADTKHDVTMRGNVEMRTLFINPGSDENLPKSASAFDVSPLLKALILSLLEEPTDYQQAGRGADIARLIFSEISRATPLSLEIPMPTDARLSALCQMLLDEPHRSDTLDDWSQTIGASPRTLSRLFSRETGLSFTAWRQRVRFHNAMEALVRGEAIATIARQNGYASPSAFSHRFRKIFGVTPGSLNQFRP